MLISTVEKKEPWELEKTLFEEIEDAKTEISRLRDRFDFENDPVLIDEIIYKLCAAEIKYSALMEKARKKAS